MSDEETTKTTAENPNAGEGSMDAAAAYAISLRQSQEQQAAASLNGAGDAEAAQKIIAQRQAQDQALDTANAASGAGAGTQQAAAVDAQVTQASLSEENKRATQDGIRNVQGIEMNGLLMFLQILVALFTGDTSKIDRIALGDFSESLGMDRNNLGNTLNRVNRGEISGIRAATETFQQIQPDRIDYAAASRIRLGDIVGRNTGETLLHPDLVAKMQSDPTVRQYVEWTYDAAERNGLEDPAMLANQYWQESKYKPNAVSGADAAGIAQIMPFHQGDWGLNTRADFFDPKTSIEAGAQYMAHLTQEYGDQSLALVAYNGGGKAIDYADRNVAGDGVTVGQWMGFMQGQRESLGTSDPSKWRVQTFEYVQKIDSNYWDSATVERALALQEQALASIDREQTPEQSQALAAAYRPEDNQIRENLQQLASLGGAGLEISGRGTNNASNRAHMTAVHHEAVARSPNYNEVIADVSEELPHLAPHLHRFKVGDKLVIDREYAARLDGFMGEVEARGGTIESNEYNMVNVLGYRLESGGRTNGVLLNSPHLMGRAWDGKAEGIDSGTVTELAEKYGLGTVTPRQYSERGASFTHLDLSMNDRRYREAYADPMVIERPEGTLLASLPNATEKRPDSTYDQIPAATQETMSITDAGTDGNTPQTITSALNTAATATDPLAPSDATPVESLTSAFGPPDAPQGTDQIAAAASEQPPAELVAAASATTSTPTMSRPT